MVQLVPLRRGLHQLMPYFVQFVQEEVGGCTS
jgi:hypothetical protein